MKLYVTICATESYTYAMRAQARRVVGAILGAKCITHGAIVLVGDSCAEMDAVEKLYRDILPKTKIPGTDQSAWIVIRVTENWRDKLPNYQEYAQRLIAEMRTAAFDVARSADADFCWSLDSDVLPQANALDVMVNTLEFDKGFYGIATCPYVSQGGGDFLGGRGSPENPIFPDVYTDERLIAPELQVRIDKLEARLKELKNNPDEAWKRRQKKIKDEIARCPIKGDIFFLNSGTGVKPFVEELKKRVIDTFPRNSPLAKKMCDVIDKEALRWKPRGYRRRGWLSAAFPAVGRGAVLPTNWCGFGCTLMSRAALSHAQFDGYNGGGTEDLYIVYMRWLRAGLRINVIPHCPADHVIRERGKDGKVIVGKFVLMQAYHYSNPRDPEWEGHLRRDPRPWFQQTPGETPETMATALADKPKPSPKKERTALRK